MPARTCQTADTWRMQTHTVFKKTNTWGMYARCVHPDSHHVQVSKRMPVGETDKANKNKNNPPPKKKALRNTQI